MREREGKLQVYQKAEDALSNCLGCQFVGAAAWLCPLPLHPGTFSRLRNPGGTKKHLKARTDVVIKSKIA